MHVSVTQQQAISHYKGPAIVLAGPGSGKTTVITHRIKHLIEECKVLPADILVITFTKMAAEEMRQRFSKLTGAKYSSVTFGTFHSVYFKILKHTYNYRANCIIKHSEQIAVIQDLTDREKLSVRDKNEFAESIISQISKVKSDGSDIDNYVPPDCTCEFFRKAYNEYSSYLKQRLLLDFDDMILTCLKLLKERKDILDIWQNKYRYILIDEFQDICNSQFDVINLIAQKERNIFIVGDDDQSIYGFRGADPGIMMGFKSVYPEAVQINLNTNYRSDGNIVYAARSVIDNNKNRFYKDIEAFNENKRKVLVKEFNDADSECLYVVGTIKEAVYDIDSKEEYDGHEQDRIRSQEYSDFGILTRTNTGMSKVIQKLIEHNVPFITREKVNNIFEHWIAYDIEAYLNIAAGRHGRKDVIRIINKPVRYIKRESMNNGSDALKSMLEYYNGNTPKIKVIEDFIFGINIMSNMSVFAAINYIRKGFGYESYLKQYADENGCDADELVDFLDQIQDSAREYNSVSGWLEFVKNFRKDISDTNYNKEVKSNAVNVCTMHGSKGLEYKNVFILDANEGNIPYSKAVIDDEIEEERRMFYVAITRAKESLCICYTKMGRNKQVEKSSFLEEMDRKFIVEEKLHGSNADE